MKQIITLCLLLLSGIIYAQTVTIDYAAWNPSNPPCRAFAGNTTVPATGAPSGIAHITYSGQPYYSTSDQTIQIQTRYDAAGAGAWNGGAYRISYNFKANYSYTIYITAAAVELTVGDQTGPYFRLDVDNSSGGLAANAPCNGPDQVAHDLSGNPAAQKLSDTAMTEYQFIMPALGTQSTLNITAFPAANGGTKTVRIKKIRIEETPPPVSFTLPGTTTFACGSTTAINFAATNVYSTTGVTNYTWNLGATPNGWLYNSAAAPATVSTGTTGSISLTPACNTVPKNVSATVTANGNTYSTNTSTVSVTQPDMSISGANSFCSGSSTYSISGLPCNASVAWSVAPTGIVTPTTSTATSQPFTQTGNGNITISATVTSCGTAQPTITKAVKVGGFTSADYTMTGGSSSTQPLYWCPNKTYGFSVNGSGSNYVWTIPTGWTVNYQSGYVCAIKAPASSSPPTGTVSVTFTEPCGSQITKSFFTAYSSSACGPDPRFTYSPNPAPSYLNVAVASGYTSTVSIKRIQIVSVSTGLTVFDQSYGGTLSAYITTSGFATGTYNLRIYDGSVWAVYQFVR